MSELVPLTALTLAAAAAIMGLLFYRDDIWRELRRKRSGPVAGADGSAAGMGPHDWNCPGGAGADGGGAP